MSKSNSSHSRQRTPAPTTYDVDFVRSAARSQWPAILSTLGNVDLSALDGDHHPCPKCGGSDRFRLIDAEAGALLCNQCFSRNNGDGFAALQWLLSIKFGPALKLIADHLGIEPISNGHASSTSSRKSSRSAEPDEHLDFQPWNESLISLWCLTKPPITPAAISSIGGRLARYRNQYTVIALPVYGPDRTARPPVGYSLYNVTGGELPRKKKDGAIEWLKVKTTYCSKPGLIGQVDRLAPGVTAWKVEGPSDLLSLLSLDPPLPADHVVITNNHGAGERPQSWQVALFSGTTARVIHDADTPGELGAIGRTDSAGQHVPGWADSIATAATECRHVRLPYPIEPSHGKDLRDWANEGGTFSRLLELAAAVEPLSALASTPSNADWKTDHTLTPNILLPEGQTEAANARRLACAHVDQFHWIETWGKYVCWDGARWAHDQCRTMDAWAKGVHRDLWKRIGELLDGGSFDEADLRPAMSFARSTGTARGIRSMIELARSERDVAVNYSVFDRDPWMLNLQNGTINLRSMEILPHSKADMLTKVCPVAYDPNATCPRWETFVEEIMCSDQALVSYLRRAVGFTLTGDTSEHALFFCYGKGSNGKSVFLKTLLTLLGNDYSMKAPSDLLLARNGDAHPTERADLAGKRLVACIESDDGRRLSEALVKELTGGDSIRARRMREDFWEFLPSHKIWLASNHKPTIRGADDGIWRRIKLIPFEASFLGREVKDLTDQLRDELPGILNWALAGLGEWIDSRDLHEPAAIRNAVTKYKKEMDRLQPFINECCIVDPEQESRAKDLYNAYAEWAGKGAMSRTAFGNAITGKGFKKTKSNGIWYSGIGLADPPVEEDEEKTQSKKTANTEKSHQQEIFEPHDDQYDAFA